MSEAKIQIRIGAVEVTCSGDVDTKQLEDVLGSLRSQLPDLMQASPSADQGPSVRELLDASIARTHGDKAGIVAWWLEHHRGHRDWRSGDILAALKDAGETPPANITDALNQKLRKGLFENEDRRWKLSGEGRGWVKYHLLANPDED